MKLAIVEDCCALARQMIAEGLDPSEPLEFYRGNERCLRGTARAFAIRRVKYRSTGQPYHARLTEGEMASAGLPVSLLRDPLDG